MKYLMSAQWWQAAGIRAVKTMFQTGAALLVTQMPGGAVDWVSVGSAALLAGIASLGTSLAGLPELEKQDKEDGGCSADKGTASCHGKKKSPPVFGELLRQEYSHGQEFRNRDDSGVRNGGLQKILISGKEQVSVCV